MMVLPGTGAHAVDATAQRTLPRRMFSGWTPVDAAQSAAELSTVSDSEMILILGEAECWLIRSASGCYSQAG